MLTPFRREEVHRQACWMLCLWSHHFQAEGPLQPSALDGLPANIHMSHTMLANMPKRTSLGAKNWTRTFFSQTSRAPPGYPGKVPGYPAKKVWFPWFRGTYRTFWPPPLEVEDPHPNRQYPDPKFCLGLGSFFFPDSLEASKRPGKRKRTNRENLEKSGKYRKQPDGETPIWPPPPPSSRLPTLASIKSLL